MEKGSQWKGIESTGASNPVLSETIIPEKAAPLKVYFSIVTGPTAERIRWLATK